MIQITGVHPLADLFPMMSDPELRALAEDIKANGLREPIQVTAAGELIEGRNRLKACELAEVEPRTEVVNGDAVSLIVSANIMRRHMTKAQIAILAVLAEGGITLPDSELAGSASSKSAGSANSQPGVIVDRNRAFKRVENLVGRRTIGRAASVVRWAPDLARVVLDTGQGLDAAEQAATERERGVQSEEARREVLAEDSPELLAKVDDTFTVAEAWRVRESRIREEREKKVRHTGYLVDRVTPLLDKSNEQELIEWYDPELASRKIGTAELDEAIKYLQALRREIVKQRKDTNV